MASESARDMRNYTEDELAKKEKNLREEMFNLRFRLSTGELGDTARIKAAKKELARTLTVIKEKRDVRG